MSIHKGQSLFSMIIGGSAGIFNGIYGKLSIFAIVPLQSIVDTAILAVTGALCGILVNEGYKFAKSKIQKYYDRRSKKKEQE